MPSYPTRYGRVKKISLKAGTDRPQMVYIE